MKSLNDYITEFININNIKKHFCDVVDLDLPSGTKWSTCNIGADKPEDAGLLFQWGITEGYKYGDKNHKFLKHTYYKEKYNNNYTNGQILDDKDDAAYQTTNGVLRMPTSNELYELINDTDYEWYTLNNIIGIKFISKKDKSKWIFIPICGWYDAHDDKFIGEKTVCGLWASNMAATGSIYEAEFVEIDKDECADITTMFKYDAFSIRGVLNT